MWQLISDIRLTAQKMIGFNCPSFEQFVVSPKGDAVLQLSDYVNNSGQEVSGACRHVEFPIHTSGKLVERNFSQLKRTK